MFRRSPRAALLAAAALVVAVVTAVVVVDAIASLRHQDADYGRLHPVVVARHDLRVGARLQAGDVSVRQIRGDAPTGLTDAADAVGRVVRVPVLAGTPVTTGHLAAANRSGRSATVPPDRRAVRLVVEHGLRPDVGDPVDVFATFDPQVLGDAEDPTILVAPAVPAVAVETTTGDDTVAVTVLVTPHQASRLAFSSVAGVISLALAPPEAAATG